MTVEARSVRPVADSRRLSTVARAVGAASLATMALGVVGQTVFAGQVLVVGEWAQSAANVVADPGAMRWATLVYLAEMIAQVAMIALWGRLVFAASPSWAAAGVGLGLTGAAIKAGGNANLVEALAVADGAAGDLNGVAAALAAADASSAIGVMFLGLGTALLAVASARARVAPVWVAAVTAVTAAGWLVYLDKPTGDSLFGIVSLGALVGAMTLAVRFLGWGVGRGQAPEDD